MNVDAKMSAISSIQNDVLSTHHKLVYHVPNGFGGLCRIPNSDQIIVSSTDSVGSKTELIRQLSEYVLDSDKLWKGLGNFYDLKFVKFLLHSY